VLVALVISAAAQLAPYPRVFLQFDGRTNFIEVPDDAVFSVSTSGALTVAAWMRPDTLTFPRTEGSGYVYWLGKGESSRQEWVFRMYSQGNTEGRANRISFYVFDPAGGLGIGSYFEDPVTPGQWIHVVGVADGQRTNIYKNGVFRDTDVYAGSILPQRGTAPLRMGTRDFHSYFEGALTGVRVWDRALAPAEIASLYATNRAPRQGLVAEYLLDEGSGAVAADDAGRHDGTIVGAQWLCEFGAIPCPHTRLVPFR
jgi:hypothetical protein